MNNAAVAQSEESRPCKSEVIGANPIGSTILTAHQPCYFPWLGFWHKLASANRFVIFDNVQFERHGYSNRVQIKTSQGAQWLTVPVEHGLPLLKDARIAKHSWRRKHLRTIELAYQKAPYFYHYFPSVRTLLSGNEESLADLNQHIFHWIRSELKLFTSVLRASDFKFDGEKSTLVLDMCKQLGATKYVFGGKGRNYADVQAFESAGIEVSFQVYNHPVYSQLHGPFVPGLSILDLLFNEGPRSLEILRG